MNETLITIIEELHHSDHNVRGRAAVKLGKLDDGNALEVLLQALRTEMDFYVQEDITWSLVCKGEAAVAPLIRLLSDANPATRHHAAHTLGKIGDIRAVDALITALRDPDTAVIAKAAFSLGQIGDQRALPTLVHLLGHSEREIQTTIVSVMESFGTAAIEPLLGLLQHERWQIREQAADILGLIGSQEIIPLLITALEDEQWQVRFAIVTALGSIGGSSAKTVLQKMGTDLEIRVRELAQMLTARVKM
jgi:HEAT repeat protein